MRTYGFDVRGRPPRAWLLDEVGGVTTYRLSHTSSQQSWKAQAQLQGKTALIRFDGPRQSVNLSRTGQNPSHSKVIKADQDLSPSHNS